MGGLSYLFPDIKLQNEDVMEPRYFNAALADAAEKYSGNLNEHAFKENLLSTITWNHVAQGCFGKPYYDFQIASPQLTPPAPSPDPTWDTTDDGWQVPNHGDWETIDTLERTVTTDNCQIFVVAQVNYMWQHFNDTTGSYFNYPVGVQFAVRIDGIIDDSSMSGQMNPQYRSYIPAIPSAQRSEDVAIPGPALERSEVANGIGYPSGCYRIIYITPYTVQPGSHLVEIVVRRTVDRDVPIADYATDNVWIWNRRMLTYSISNTGPSETTVAYVTVDLRNPEDTISGTALTSDFTNLQGAYNSVPSGAVARGGFNWHQLPSRTILPSHMTTIEPASYQTTTAVFQGAADTTIAALSSDPGWYLLNDGAGTDLELTSLALNGKKCMLLILGNVRIRAVEYNSGAALNEIAVTALLYTDGSGTHLIEESVDYVNDWLYATGADAWTNKNSESADEINMPIFACLDFTDTAATSNISSLGVYINGTSTSGTDAPTISFQQGTLIAIPLRY